jgi:hypothetical protein
VVVIEFGPYGKYELGIITKYVWRFGVKEGGGNE